LRIRKARMHRNCLLLFSKYAAGYFKPNSKVLEVGALGSPGHYGDSLLFKTACWDTVDLEARWFKPTYLTTSPVDFPIPEDSYDIVLSSQVLEHVGPIWDWMKECARVCKPGGFVITINPVSWHFHEAPMDCWRVYPDGMIELSKFAKLDVVMSRWESLELEEYWWIPKRVLRRKTVALRLSGVLNLIGVAFHLPIEGAFDTITISQKPA
jgi:SAM-dependent methyltransferase